MHGWLILSAMFECPAQDFAIDCRLNERSLAQLFLCQRSTWFLSTLFYCSGLHDHLCDRFCYLMMVTLGYGINVGLSYWKPFRPGSELVDLLLPFVYTVNNPFQ